MMSIDPTEFGVGMSLDDLPLDPKEIALIKALVEIPMDVAIGHMVALAVTGGIDGVVNHDVEPDQAWEMVHNALTNCIDHALNVLHPQWEGAVEMAQLVASVTGDLDSIDVLTDDEFADVLADIERLGDQLNGSAVEEE